LQQEIDMDDSKDAQPFNPSIATPVRASTPLPEPGYGKCLGEAGVLGGVTGACQTARVEPTPDPSLAWGDIGFAVRWMHAGRRVARRGWNGKSMFVRLRHTHPSFSDDGFHRPNYPEMKTADGSLVPWLCSITDLMASDWYVLD
jgi:hypothetical protein